MIKRLCIIGCGLIGTSIAHSVRKHGLAGHIVMADGNMDVVARTKALQIGDSQLDDLPQAVHDADLVVLALPVGANAGVMRSIAPSLKEGVVMSDTGSVKAKVIEDVMPHMPAHAAFVPAHPIAGTENSGPEAGFDSLFDGRWSILTPTPETPLSAIQAVTQLWEGMGARVEVMDAGHHDKILAITSHLPHLIAYSIVDTAVNLGTDLQSEVIQYSAGGFRDFTRIAASNPTMWRDVFLNNKEAVLDLLERYNRDLKALEEAIRNDDGDVLFETFTRTRDIRRHVIDAKQA